MWGAVTGLIPQLLRWFAGYTIVKTITVLGVGSLTFWGYISLMETMQAEFQASFAGLPADLLAYLEISGITTGLGIILSALSIRAAIVFSPKLGLLYGAATS